MYITDKLQGESGRYISLFSTENTKVKPTPLIFFFHSHLSNTLIKALWLIRLIKMYIQIQMGKTNLEFCQTILNIIGRSRISEDKLISFLYETQKLQSTESESSLRSMWISGLLPSSYEPKMDIFFDLFTKYLPTIFKNGNDLFRNSEFLQFKKMDHEKDVIRDVISKQRISPVYHCGHCGGYSGGANELCVCGGSWGYVKFVTDVRTNA